MNHNDSNILRSDRLGNELRRDAAEHAPSFSPQLHSRIMSSAFQRDGALAGDTDLLQSKTSRQPLLFAVAVTAGLLIGLTTALLAIPERTNVASSVPGLDSESTSTLEMANAISAATSTGINDFVQATSDELVDSVVSDHLRFVEQNADQLATFLLDPLPIDIGSPVLD